jgi:hypothetical protein
VEKSNLDQINQKRIEFSAFSVPHNFSVLRLNVIQIIYTLVYHDSKIYDLYQFQIVELFEILIHWFFEYRHNNIYHNVFYTFIALLFSDREDDIIKTILTDFNLIERMIDVYMDKTGDYDNKGHILDICNLIRLTSKCMSENSFLCSHLKSHQRWNSFQEIMIRDTLSEINSSKIFDIQIGSECKN